MTTRAVQAAFLTGQSDPCSCALSPAQHAFLDALPLPEASKVRWNFPYDGRSGPYRTVGLLPASWHNARQFLAARSPAFAPRYREAALALVAGADRTVFLAGSCGLELLANLDLPSTALARIHVFAYGAVARRRPRCETLSVRGRWDLVAAMARGPVDQRVRCHHLNYLEAPEVLAACVAFLERVGRQP